MGRPALTDQQKRESLIARFHVGYKKAGPADCWLWTGTVTGNGYGALGTGKRGTVYVHRLALELSAGPPPREDSFACHTCDVRLCVNPGHLYWGDIMTNNADIRDRGNALKIRCRRGHLKTPDNLYVRTDGRGYIERHCRACMALRAKK